MNDLARLLLLIFFAKCTCVLSCPYKNQQEAFAACKNDMKQMKVDCPYFYCGLGQACDAKKADPHRDCRKYDSAGTSSYCHLHGMDGYECGEITDGKVPSKYENGKCVHQAGTSASLCGLDTCPKGKFGAKTAAKKPNTKTWFPTTCQLCPDGSFSENLGAHACQCPSPGKEAVSEDENNPDLKTKQQDCKPGFYNDRMYTDSKLAQDDTSLWEPKGFKYVGTPCGKCEKCPANSFSKGLKGNPSCECPTRGHEANKDQTGNAQCPKGKFQDKGETWARDVACPKCRACSEQQPGSFAEALGQAKCDCPKSGYEANEDGTAERPCRPGTYKNDTLCEKCQKCPDGEYQNSPGSHECDIPSTGHYAVNSTSEQPCMKGTYKPGKGPALECLKCKPGHYGAITAADSCLTASVGHQPASASDYAKKMGLFDTQIPCRPGKYQDARGQQLCKQCPKGRFARGSSQSLCDCASSGHVANPEGSGEIPCPRGTYTSDKPSQMDPFCVSNDSSTGNWACTECEKGRFGEHRHGDNCSLCAEGKFQKHTGKTICEKCPVNSYTNEMGKQVCKNCQLWEFQEKMGATECNFCITMDAAFGFAHPSQCLIVWVLLGIIMAIVIVALTAKFCTACGSCCGTMMMMCKGNKGAGGDKTIIIREGGSSHDEEEEKPVKKAQLKPQRKSHTLMMGGGGGYDESSSDDEEMIYTS